MIDIFLSASVPLPERDRRFFDTADVFLIREAIRALIEVVLPVGRITFGGHPAITPLISLYVEHGNLEGDRLTLFQSEYFRGKLPAENKQFADVRYVAAVKGDKNRSVAAMRKEMLSSRKFNAAVLIGGMEGVADEMALFKELHPAANVLPVPSTGAAAGAIFSKGGYSPELADDISFGSMFRRNLLPRPR